MCQIVSRKLINNRGSYTPSMGGNADNNRLAAMLQTIQKGWERILKGGEAGVQAQGLALACGLEAVGKAVDGGTVLAAHGPFTAAGRVSLFSLLYDMLHVCSRTRGSTHALPSLRANMAHKLYIYENEACKPPQHNHRIPCATWENIESWPSSRRERVGA